MNRSGFSILVFSLTCASLIGMRARAGDANSDACKLITPAEVEQVLGKLARAPKSERNDRLRTCDYTFRESGHSLSIWLLPGEAMQRARKELQSVLPVAGLGDSAFLYANTQIGFTELYVKKGNVVLQVSIPKAEGSEVKAQTLAKKALPRLQ
jgi:hypothetical protein